MPARGRRRARAPPPRAAARVARAARRGAGLPLRLRSGGRAGRGLRARGRAARGCDARRAEALGRRLVRGVRARALPGRAAAAVLAPRPGAQPLAGRLAERLGVPCVATGNVHAHDRGAAPLQDALVAIRLGALAGRDRGRFAAATAARCWRRRRRWRRGSPSIPEAVAETARLAERLSLRPHPRPRLPLSRAPRTRTPIASWPSSARRASPAATRARRSCPRRGGGWRRSCG